MKRFTFDSFHVSELNQEAVDVCRAAADLQGVSSLPVTLWGEAQSGKTHLLYSVVNAVRGDSRKPGLAYITAKEFPKQVRILIKNPTPLEKARYAILLVDDLQDFSKLTEELESIVRLFLKNRHAVVLATSKDPAQLQNLTLGLRELIARGRTLCLRPDESRPPTVENELKSGKAAPTFFDRIEALLFGPGRR